MFTQSRVLYNQSLQTRHTKVLAIRSRQFVSSESNDVTEIQIFIPVGLMSCAINLSPVNKLF